MTNLEKYNKIVKQSLGASDSDLNDDVLVYNRFPSWDSVAHVEMVADLEEKFEVLFSTLDITSFGKYSLGIEILTKLGVDMEK
ncbi:MAG: acyl carrier protein [Lachnospiraceae bacterium]|jgi:acyl carrier protein